MPRNVVTRIIVKSDVVFLRSNNTCLKCDTAGSNFDVMVVVSAVE